MSNYEKVRELLQEMQMLSLGEERGLLARLLVAVEEKVEPSNSTHWSRGDDIIGDFLDTLRVWLEEPVSKEPVVVRCPKHAETWKGCCLNGYSLQDLEEVGESSFLRMIHFQSDR